MPQQQPPSPLAEVLQEVMDDLRLDAFPRFEAIIYFKSYSQCKVMEEKKAFGIRDFLPLRPLGRGTFALEHACEKHDCGKLSVLTNGERGCVMSMLLFEFTALLCLHDVQNMSFANMLRAPADEKMCINTERAGTQACVK